MSDIGQTEKTGAMSEIALFQITATDHDWIARWATERWGKDLMVAHGTVYRISELPGFVARVQGEVIGLVTYHILENACEIVSMDSTRPGGAVGSSLLEAVKTVAQHHACTRLWLITTDDNFEALRFYQKRGFRVVAIHPDAVAKARVLEPEIPLIGDSGSPIRDEIELEWCAQGNDRRKEQTTAQFLSRSVT
jgi:ribosomal protein S18 acetylase RimI-like enzyme